MKTKHLICLVTAIFLFTGCEVHMGPSEYWSKLFRPQTDSDYYRGKSEKLVKKISKGLVEYDINRIAIIDLVDEGGNVPILGEYMSSRVVEATANNSYLRKKNFRVTQKGEINQVMAQLNLKPTFFYTKNELKNLGKALQSEAILTGKITDLGTNLDVHLSLTDVVTGEVIASATENLNRTKFAVEMLRRY